jgi:hypothetical protein
MPLFSPGARRHPNLRLSMLAEKMHAHLRSSINNGNLTYSLNFSFYFTSSISSISGFWISFDIETR